MSQEEDYLKTLEARIRATRQRIATRDRYLAQLQRRRQAITRAVDGYMDDFDHALESLGWAKPVATKHGFTGIEKVLADIRRHALDRTAHTRPDDE